MEAFSIGLILIWEQLSLVEPTVQRNKQPNVSWTELGQGGWEVVEWDNHIVNQGYDGCILSFPQKCQGNIYRIIPFCPHNDPMRQASLSVRPCHLSELETDKTSLLVGNWILGLAGARNRVEQGTYREPLRSHPKIVPHSGECATFWGATCHNWAHP